MTSSINYQDTKINYLSFGSGNKTLVILPGLSLTSIKGKGLLLALKYRLFSKEYKVYVIDHKEEIKGEYNVKMMSDELSHFVKMMKLKDLYLMGVAEGGMIATRFAIDYPSLVKKLVLAVTTSRNNDNLRFTINRWIRMAKREDYSDLCLDFFKRSFSQKYNEKHKFLIYLLSKFTKPSDKDRFISLLKACLTCDNYDEIEKISCRTLVIGATLDDIVTARASLEIQMKLNCRIYMYQNLGHACFVEDKEFKKKVFNFFAEK